MSCFGFSRVLKKRLSCNGSLCSILVCCLSVPFLASQFFLSANQLLFSFAASTVDSFWVVPRPCLTYFLVSWVILGLVFFGFLGFFKKRGFGPFILPGFCPTSWRNSSYRNFLKSLRDNKGWLPSLFLASISAPFFSNIFIPIQAKKYIG